MTKDNLDSYLRKDCYVQEDSLSACKSGDDQVGYDKAGRVRLIQPPKIPILYHNLCLSLGLLAKEENLFSTAN